MTRARLDLAYDGTHFHGWARQPGQRTVEAALAAALATALRVSPPPPLTVAGRTDAGVHATGQVAHVDVPEDVELAGLAGRLNGLLPPDVRVRAVASAPAGFDARFSALSRAYRYRLTDAVPDPLRRHDTYAVTGGALDVAGMADAAAALLGLHDFAAFCRAREQASTVRALLRLECRRRGELVTVDAEADAFCHHMVRALVGALVAVGQRRRPVGWPAQVLGAGQRDPAVRVVPAHGLTLVAVRYPPDDQLAERAALTRARRVLPPPALPPPAPAASTPAPAAPTVVDPQ